MLRQIVSLFWNGVKLEVDHVNCFFSVTLMWDLSILQQVRTICLLSFSGRFLKSFMPRTSQWSCTGLCHQLGAIQNSTVLQFLVQRIEIICPSGGKQIQVVFWNLQAQHITQRLYASRTTEKLQGKNNLSHSYGICIRYTGEHTGSKELFFGI